MQISEEQLGWIEPYFPRQRGNVSMTNLKFINAVMYVAEHGCKWRGLPKEFGNWHTIYTRMNRWSKNGVLDAIFTAMQKERIIQVAMTTVCMDSTAVKVHPDGMGL